MPEHNREYPDKAYDPARRPSSPYAAGITGSDPHPLQGKIGQQPLKTGYDKTDA